MNVVKELRERHGIQQKELAIAIGVKQPTVSEWEHGKKDPSGERLEKLAIYFGVTKSVILGFDPLDSDKSTVIHASSSKEYITIPVLGSIPAGIPFEAIEDILDWEDLPLEDTLPGRKYFGLRITGDSMEPEYRSGDTIIIQQQDHCNSGDDCAVMVNGDDATFKRVRLQENGLTLQPLNPKYDPRFFTAKEIQNLPVRILGIVVEIRRNLRK